MALLLGAAVPAGGKVPTACFRAAPQSGRVPWGRRP